MWTSQEIWRRALRSSSPLRVVTYDHPNLRHLLLIAALISFHLPAEAFTTCIISSAIVPKIKGRVIVTFKGRQSTAPGAQIQLFRSDENGVMIAKTSADSIGHFQISGIKVGRYRIRATSPGLVAAEAIVDVSTRHLLLFQRHGTLLISLGLGLDLCPFVQVVRK